MITNNITNFIGCLCYRCDINTDKNFVAVAKIIQEKSYLSPLERDLPGKVSLNDSCLFLVVAVAEWYRYRIVACLVTSSSPVPLKTRRVGQRCTLNLSRAETSSRWCGVVVRRGRCQLRCRPRHLTMVQNYVVRRQKPLM
ncbi:uncharacterized protein TNCV_3099301 [Trichonephila clavipes]|nr:uncharacterized protein TNCV_3099301 [Trichonephila clavipes]